MTCTQRRTLTAGAAVLTVVLLAACADDGQRLSLSAADLDGRTFLATAVEGHELVAGSTVSVAFDGSTVAVHAGCNSMTGAYSLTDDAVLRTPDLARTMMACDEALMAQDDWFAAFLAAEPEATLDGDELVLATDDATVRAVAER